MVYYHIEVTTITIIKKGRWEGRNRMKQKEGEKEKHPKYLISWGKKGKLVFEKQQQKT